MKGFDAPPFTIHYDEMPALDGARERHVRAQSRELFIPLFFYARDRPSLLGLKRQFLASLNPAYGPGRISVKEGDGSERFVNAYYVSGAEGDEGRDKAGFVWLKYGLVLRAMDPYWHSFVPVVIDFQAASGEVRPFFSVPFLGLNISRSHSLNGESEVTITGDVDTWPDWIISGPFTKVTFTNTITERSFVLNRTTLAGEQVKITTSPGNKAVVDADTGDNLWNFLGPNPDLWPITPGLNRVRIDVENVGPETGLVLYYFPRYLSV
ncbi:hypothetical protein ACFV0L_10405 [Streptosporangium canum]|uniref:hypothetical protein n=1 Tax=Streptosporangium canum TaxID=324952 RepID=UPI0036C89BD2